MLPDETPDVLRATYLLPIRLSQGPDPELTQYLHDISRHCRVVIVDGSTPPVFQAAHGAWKSFALHIAPADEWRCANGKVHGVLTGLQHVETPLLIIADDDVRYSPGALARCLDALERADLVRPQNYFDPLPWHARWDTARILLNRVTGGDFPGTLLVRTAILRSTGGYNGDVLFENLEMMRTVHDAGGTCVSRPDLYVRRIPPTTRHFVGQRVRQAYDEFARPHRLLANLAILPVTLSLVATRRGHVLVGAIAVAAAAEAGRRRSDGRRWFPATSSLLAPFWLMERGLCTWVAAWYRLTGGVRYGSGKLIHAATPRCRRPVRLRCTLRPLSTTRSGLDRTTVGTVF